MVRFEELQQLWQSQSQAEPPVVAAESRGMAAALRRFQRRQHVINGIKLMVIVSQAWFMLSRLGLSWHTVLGEGLLLTGFMNATFTDWRIQSAIARLDFTRPSAGFVDDSLERLRNPNAPFRQAGWLCSALVAVGVNLLFEGPAATKTLDFRLGSWAAVTLLTLAAFAFGLKLRARRYAMEYEPLMKRLRAMKAALGERAE